MNFQGKAVLVYLEEDNIARAYFRIQPLMTQDGPVGDTKSAYPDDGYLRIVPDKNEQHTFKERMRTLCGLCIVDLRHQPAEANKIRTNKNYSPMRGETNQYIIYSDAVREMPDDLVYQVVPEGGVATAATPFVYIREGANIQGPYRREDGQPAGETEQLPPDSARIHSVTVNGQELLFYWAKQEEIAPAAEPVSEEAASVPVEEKTPQQNAYEQIQALNVAPSATANRLHEPVSAAPVDFVPDQPAKPLAGTKLYQAPQRQVPSARRAHNALMETVESQRYVGRYEAPGATLPQNAELKEVANPASALKRALQGMWQSTETQHQAVDVLMAQPEMRALLSQALSKETNNLTVAALHNQLQDLEAERLMTLMQLDDVKKNLAAARKEAIGKLTAKEQEALDALRAQQQSAKAALDEVKAALEPMEQERQKLAEKIQQLENGWETAPHFSASRTGASIEKAALISRVEAALRAAGFIVEEGDAQAVLTAFALADHEWECCCDTEEDAQTALEAFASALGVSLENTGYKSETVLLPGGNAPVLLNVRCDHLPLVTSSYTNSFANRKGDGCAVTVPCVPFYGDLERLPQALPHYEPVSKECIEKEMLSSVPLAPETQAVLISLRKAIAEHGGSLPLSSVQQACRFIAATQNDLKGGVAEAIDRAVCLYFIPHILGRDLPLAQVEPLLAAMPRALKSLNA